MNQYIKIVLLVVLAMFFIFFIACEGPAGPAGVDGIDGVDGTDGADGVDITSAACLRCHSEDIVYGMRAELNLHDHATMANSLSRGGRAGCGRCHSHENFINYVNTGEDKAVDPVTGLTCKSCHKLHDSADVDDFTWDLRANGDIEFLTGETGSFGKVFEIMDASSNLCLNCHQARRGYDYYDSTPDNAADDVSLTSSHSGPHYGQTGNLIFGWGADNRNGTVALDQGPGTHSQVGCVPCHMGDGNTHTFRPDIDNCVSCHAGADDFDINGAETAMHDAVHAIELAFVALGALEDDGEGGFDQTASSGSPTVLTGVQFSAFWNYLMLHADHGYAIHNPPFVKAVINSIEENLGLVQTAW